MQLACLQNYRLDSGLVFILLAASESRLKQGVLARSLGINKNAMVHLVDNLELRRLIKRVPNPDNRRERLIEITPKGKHIVDDIRSNTEEYVRWGYAPLTDAQIEQLRTLLTIIIEADAAGKVSVTPPRPRKTRSSAS
jgi:DNA-binding MarR family transcriptional regulator